MIWWILCSPPSKNETRKEFFSMEAQFDKNTCMNYCYSTQNVAHFRLKNNIYMSSYLTLSLFISSLIVLRSLSLFFLSLNCQNLNELKEERKKFLQILSNKVNIRLRIYESHIFELQIKTWMKVILAVMYTTWAVVKIRPGKNSGLYGIWTHDLCDIGAPNFFQALFSLLLK